MSDTSSCWQCERPLGTGPSRCLACAAKRAEDRVKTGALLVVGHTCGHVRTHHYANEDAARMDKQRQAARACPECRERP